jgi:hypothetical protein
MGNFFASETPKPNICSIADKIHQREHLYVLTIFIKDTLRNPYEAEYATQVWIDTLSKQQNIRHSSTFEIQSLTNENAIGDMYLTTCLFTNHNYSSLVVNICNDCDFYRQVFDSSASITANIDDKISEIHGHITNVYEHHDSLIDFMTTVEPIIYFNEILCATFKSLVFSKNIVKFISPLTCPLECIVKSREDFFDGLCLLIQDRLESSDFKTEKKSTFELFHTMIQISDDMTDFMSEQNLILYKTLKSRVMKNLEKILQQKDDESYCYDVLLKILDDINGNVGNIVFDSSHTNLFTTIDVDNFTSTNDSEDANTMFIMRFLCNNELNKLRKITSGGTETLYKRIDIIKKLIQDATICACKEYLNKNIIAEDVFNNFYVRHHSKTTNIENSMSYISDCQCFKVLYTLDQTGDMNDIDYNLKLNAQIIQIVRLVNRKNLIYSDDDFSVSQPFTSHRIQIMKELTDNYERLCVNYLKTVKFDTSDKIMSVSTDRKSLKQLFPSLYSSETELIIKMCSVFEVIEIINIDKSDISCAFQELYKLCEHLKLPLLIDISNKIRIAQLDDCLEKYLRIICRAIDFPEQFVDNLLNHERRQGFVQNLQTRTVCANLRTKGFFVSIALYNLKNNL